MNLTPLSEHQSARLRHHAAQEGSRPNGIACPRCANELLDSNSSVILTTNPPQKSIHCASCGWTGFRFS